MKRYSFILPLAFVLVLNVYFRTYTINFPQLKIHAENTVNKIIYQDIIRQVNRDFPQFDVQAKDRLISERLTEYENKNKRQIGEGVEGEYLKLKDKYQDPRGQTYLMELDCWNWARYVDNVLRLGHPGDRVIDGQEIDTLMLAPYGAPLAWNKFLFYASAFLYKAFSLIRPVELNTFLFYLPLFF
ncbi:MAG: STT3 domain-containing protein, partial [Candidatus Omnitrophica bacterium]|nr:STT3 domain-containing protein [Candidatus Omnitrophota bacterium]